MTRVCSHDEYSTTYHDSGDCETPYCTWSECRCKKCGKYVQRCGCGYRNGESGWPEIRWRSYWRQKELKRIGHWRKVLPLDRNAKG